MSGARGCLKRSTPRFELWFRITPRQALATLALAVLFAIPLARPHRRLEA